ncbi:MAG: replicative DNA helicase [Acidobacteria bacterium]|nr:replicative DNA helicase [Acidobacteriota bacterium]
MTTIDSTLDKVLPHSDEAERSILGAVLQKNHLFNHAAEVLSRDDFYMDRHQVIFTAMGELSEKTRPIDLLTLKDELQRKELLEASGGVAYLASLIDGVPVVDNIDAYTRMVKERSILRKLIYLSNQLMNRCFEDQEEALDILEAAEQQIFQIAQEKVRKGFVALQPLAKETYKYLQDLSEQKLKTTGIATGFTDLDTLTSGLQRSDLIIVAARPAMGKTSFCLNVAQHAAIVQEKVVGILSLEMSAPQIVMRLLCSLARVDAHKMRTGHLGHEDWARLATALDQLSKARIFIDDSATLSIVELRSKARRLKTEHRLDLLIVDYLQLISAKGENRTQEISAISRALKGLAKELEIPVVALSQLSRAPEHRRGDHRPQLSDLRESGSIEQDADVVMFIFREEEYKRTEENQGKAQIILGKQRNGPTDSFELAFLKPFTKFENLWKGDE